MAATFFIEDRMRKLTKKRRNNCRELEEFLLQIVMETGRCQSVPPSLVPTQVTCYVTKTPDKIFSIVSSDKVESAKAKAIRIEV